jgi:hypothetical protein
MAMAMLLLAADADISLGPDTTASLARLGITRAVLLGDGDQVAVVLEGWAFDPGRFAAEVAESIAGGSTPTRVLRSLADVAVRSDARAWAPGHPLPRKRREES